MIVNLGRHELPAPHVDVVSKWAVRALLDPVLHVLAHVNAAALVRDDVTSHEATGVKERLDAADDRAGRQVRVAADVGELNVGRHEAEVHDKVRRLPDGAPHGEAVEAEVRRARPAKCRRRPDSAWRSLCRSGRLSRCRDS